VDTDDDDSSDAAAAAVDDDYAQWRENCRRAPTTVRPTGRDAERQWR